MKPTIYSFTLWLLLLALFGARPAEAQDKSLDQLTMAQATAANAALADVLQKSGMMPLLSNKGPYTFFVPSASALQELAAMDPTAAREILMGHIVEGRLTAADLHDGATLTSMAKQTIRVFRKKGKLMLNGITVTTTDQAVHNGMMHTVEGLLAKNILQTSML